MWRSLVARVVRGDEAAGSNPVIPTQGVSTVERVSCLHSKPRGGWFTTWGRMFQGGDRPLQGPCGGFNSHRFHKLKPKQYKYGNYGSIV